MNTFPDLRFDDRVLILVPNTKFRDKIREPLLQHLQAVYAKQPGLRECELVTADEACATLPFVHHLKERIILDSMDNCDGLERLIAFVVAMDQRAGKPGIGATRAMDRSLLYRGVSRGQFEVVVINEGQWGGWLQHITGLESANKDDDLDFDKQRGAINTDAAKERQEKTKRAEFASKLAGLSAYTSTPDLSEMVAVVQSGARMGKQELQKEAGLQKKFVEHKQHCETLLIQSLESAVEKRTLSALEEATKLAESAHGFPEKDRLLQQARVNILDLKLSTITPEGWLLRQSRWLKSWRRRWFVAEGQLLYISRGQSEAPRVVIDLVADVESIDAPAEPLYHMNLRMKKTSQFHDEMLRAESQADFDRWMTLLSAPRRGSVSAMDLLSIPIISDGLKLPAQDLQQIDGLMTKFEERKQRLEAHLEALLSHDISRAAGERTLGTLQETCGLAEMAHDFGRKRELIASAHTTMALLDLDAKLQTGPPSSTIGDMIPVVRKGMRLQTEDLQRLDGLEKKFHNLKKTLEARLEQGITHAVDGRDLAALQKANALLKQSHEFGGKGELLTHAATFLVLIDLDSKLTPELASSNVTPHTSSSELFNVLSVLTLGLGKDLHQIPGLEQRYDDLKQKIGSDSGLAIAMEKLDLDLITKALALAEKSPHFEGSKIILHEADILSRNLQLKATFEAALSSSPDLRVMVGVLTENSTLVQDEDKRPDIIGEIEAQVSTRVQTLLLQELAGATESKDKKKTEEALHLASLLHEFEGKSNAVAKAQTVTQMNTRIQAIWDTSRTITAVRGEYAAFDEYAIFNKYTTTFDPLRNVEEDMSRVVLAMNDLSKDRIPGDDNKEVKRGSLKLMEVAGGDNSMENFPQFAHILEALKVLDYSGCTNLTGQSVSEFCAGTTSP